MAPYNDARQHSFNAAYSYPWPRGEEPSKFNRFSTWDIGNYLRLAKHGYERDDPCCAFFPLFPVVIGYLYNYLPKPWNFGACYVVSGFLAFFALSKFYTFSVSMKGKEIGIWATLLIAATPGAVFLFVPYTESLFLLLSLLFIQRLERGSLLVLMVTAFLLPLCRAVGIFAVIPAAFWIFHPNNRPRAVLAILSIVAGYSFYLVIMWLSTGNFLEGYEAQRFFVNKPSIANIFAVPKILSSATDIVAVFDPVAGGLDRALFILMICSLPLVFRMDRSLALYTAAIGIIPALTNLFLSYTRFFVLCFPCFLALAEHFVGNNKAKRLIPLIGGGVIIQLIAWWRFISFEWIG